MLLQREKRWWVGMMVSLTTGYRCYNESCLAVILYVKISFHISLTMDNSEHCAVHGWISGKFMPPGALSKIKPRGRRSACVSTSLAA